MAETKEETKPKSENTTNLVEDLYFGVAEKTVAESAYHTKSYLRPYNPDDLWQKQGDYSIYEEMGNDDQVNVALQLKTDLVIGSGWSIITDDNGDPAVADDISRRLENDPEIAFDDQLEELIDSGFKFGYGLAEKIFMLRDDQSLTLKEIKTRHPDTWLLHTDKKGVITKYEQRGSNSDLDINPKSLMHYINNRRYQNPYGTSDLRACYNAYFVKRHIIRYYSIFLEKHASPTPVAKYDSNVPQEKVDKMFDIIKRFQTKTAIVIPKEFELSFLEASNNGDTYIKGINLFNMFIGRSLLVPDLMGFQGGETGGGAFALGKEQMNIFFKHINRRRATLERMVNKHIIQPLAAWNHGVTENFPRFKFDPIQEENAEQFARIFLEAVKGRVYKPSDEEINHFRNLIKFPEGDVEQPEPMPSPFGGQNADKENESKINDKQDKKENKGAKEKDDKEEIDKAKKEEKDFAEKPAFDTPEGGFSDKVNFEVISKQLDSTQNKIVSSANLIMDDIFADLTDQIEKKKILFGDGKPERITTLKIKKLSTLKQMLKKSLRDHYKESQIIARNELFKRSFADPLPSEDFLEFLDLETFQYIGDWEYIVNSATQTRLRNALKDGKPLSQVINEIENDVRGLGQTSIDRFARTKTTEVMNRARVDEFEKSNVVDGYQFSAVMDGRTTEICAGLHGKNFKKGTQPIPPLHFNCRSIVVPITIFEEYSPDKSVKVNDRIVQKADGSKEVKYAPSKNGSKTVGIDEFIDNQLGSGFSRR